jgi:hypothetical protein
MNLANLKPRLTALLLILLLALAAGPGACKGKKAKAAPKADTVYITDTGKCYHRSSCSSLKKSKIAISRAKAKADGYKPCKRCSP